MCITVMKLRNKCVKKFAHGVLTPNPQRNGAVCCGTLMYKGFGVWKLVKEWLFV